MATPSYKERMRAARAEASAKRKARESAEQLARNTMTEARRLALQAVIAGIKARGDKPQLFADRDPRWINMLAFVNGPQEFA
jgi:hypothetical protein